MNFFEKWILRRIAEKAVIQGNHRDKITEYYAYLKDAAVNEFTEDNKDTLDYFLTECHFRSL